MFLFLGVEMADFELGVFSRPERFLSDQDLDILGDPGAVNGGARKINRRDERFHESLQGGVTKVYKEV